MILSNSWVGIFYLKDDLVPKIIIQIYKNPLLLKDSQPIYLNMMLDLIMYIYFDLHIQ